MTDDLKPLIQKLRGLVGKAKADPSDATAHHELVRALDPSTVSRLLDAAERGEERAERWKANAAAWYDVAREASNVPVLSHSIRTEWWKEYERALAAMRALIATETLAASKAKEEE